jgi:Family of unknown function (DUF5906)
VDNDTQILIADHHAGEFVDLAPANDIADLDFVTVLRSVGPLLTKVWKADRTVSSYDSALHFTSTEHRVASFSDLSALLSSLEGDKKACVIRGKLREDWEAVFKERLPTWNAERLEQGKEPIDPAKGLLRRKDLFQDTPHQWMLIDVDGFPMEEGESYLEAIERFICSLPSEFSGAPCHWQLSSSAGHPDSAGKLKAHLWFWLNRKISSAELKEWAEVFKEVGIDPSLYQTIQAHYTAAPVFEKGVVVPDIVRSGVIPELIWEGVPLEISEAALQKAKAPSKSKHELLDPRKKPGIIGAFHRVFEIEHVLDEFIPGHFEWVTDVRLTWSEGSGGAEGAFVREDRQGVGAMHYEWPWAAGHSANKWDLVRHFRFGHLDVIEDALDEVVNTDPTQSVSQSAMMDWARQLPEIIEEEQTRRREQMAENRLIGEGTDTAPVADRITLPEALQRFIYVGDGKGVFDTERPTHYLDLPSFRQFYAASVEMRGRVRIGVARLWSDHEDRMSVISRSFKAGAGVFITDPDGRSAVNTWRNFDRSGFEMRQDHVDLFIDHINFIFRDEAERFLDWLAHIEQRPGELPHTAWLSIAPCTGLGRNWISSVLARLWAGRVAANFDILGMFEKGFNGRLSGKILACVDEIKAGGSDAWPHSEKLKAIVTEETREINPKYGRQFVEHNAVRWLIFSNHLAAIPLEASDRRWEVVVNESKPLSPEYYVTLYGALHHQSFIESIAVYLQSRDIASFNPGAHAKATSGKEHVINTSKSDIDMACESVVNDWASDVIFGSDLMEQVFGYRGDRRGNLLKSAMPRLGARPFGRQVKAEGRPERVWLLRNVEKWMASDPKDVSAEGVRGRKVSSPEILGGHFG